jgi:hypothetical protein
VESFAAGVVDELFGDDAGQVEAFGVGEVEASDDDVGDLGRNAFGLEWPVAVQQCRQVAVG